LFSRCRHGNGIFIVSQRVLLKNVKTRNKSVFCLLKNGLNIKAGGNGKVLPALSVGNLANSVERIADRKNKPKIKRQSALLWKSSRCDIKITAENANNRKTNL
jgi:hypothetical protein